MGMFDTVYCKAKLPGTPPAFITDGHDFQTKSFDCLMDSYEISADGQLFQTGSGFGKIGQPQPVPFTGAVEFHTSNWSAVAHGITFTKDGEDFESVDYRALFKDGRLQGEIEETARVREKALPKSKLKERDERPSKAEVGDWKARCEKSRLGTTMHLRWGGGDPGADGVVVAESDRELVLRLVKRECECFEVVNRRDLDRTLFESAADADRIAGAKKAKRERDAAEFHALLGQK